MVADTAENPENEKKGLVSGHAYTLLGTATVTD
jgi:hypothetical protein